MKANKNDLFLIAVFLLFLLVPLAAMNREAGTISLTEKRVLAGFPKLLDENGKISDTLQSDVEDWVNDNIGFRSQFVNLAVDLKANTLHISPNSQVHIGKDGWYHYTGDRNMEIASGMYPVTDYELDMIAKAQQRASDYYKAKGIPYVLVLVPSKASVYPETIAGADYEVGVSPCDKVEAYLKEHTDVRVINTKTSMVAAKPDGLQFRRTDTHWTDLGAYTVYGQILAELGGMGLLDASPVDAAHGSKEDHTGGLLPMMGAVQPFPPEIIPTISWQRSAAVIDEDPMLERIGAFRSTSPMTLMRNESAPDKTLFIYGDSFWFQETTLTPLLGEHFRSVLMHNSRMLDSRMDEAVKPDIIFYACSEREIFPTLLDANVP